MTTVDMRGRARRAVGGWLFLLPAIAYVALFFAYPLVKNVVMGFQHYTTRTFYTGEAPFVGVDNYRAVFDDGLFGGFVVHTVLFVVVSMVGQFGLGLALAAFFNRRFPLNRLLRSLLLLPWLLPLVVSGTVWRWMLDYDHGVLNVVLRAARAGNVPWLVSSDTSLWAVILVNVWVGIPFNMVILYGGLKEIPEELYEAGEIDGAGRLRSFTSITLPLLRPVVTVVLLLGFVYTIKVLDLILVLTGGGPANSSQTLASQAYRLSFETFDFGRGAAMGNVLIVVSLVCALVYLRSGRRADAVAA